MTRLLLTWIGLAILGLGTPRATGATELHTTSEQARAVPQREAPTRGALTPDRSGADEVQASHPTPFAPAAAQSLHRRCPSGPPSPDMPSGSAPATLPHVLPDARAPPA